VIRNIIFDWSGTLVDDLPAVWKATNHVLAQAGRKALTLDEFRAEFRLPFTGFYRKFTPDVPLARLERWFHSSFAELRASVQPLPHAVECLDYCRRVGIRTFVLSTMHRRHFRSQAEAAGLLGCFEHVYLGVRDKRRRIREILKTHRLEPRATLFVGDMQHDVETAKYGGIHSCAVLTGYNTLRQLRASKPDFIVEHLGELRRKLEGEAHGDSSVDHKPVVTVGALIRDAAGRVLMIRTHKWSDLWGIPGGKIKWEETAEAALRREILEETGLRITAIRFVMVQDCIRSKEFYRDAHFVLLNYTCRRVGTGRVRLNEEGREFRWVRPREALAMPINRPTRILLKAVLSCPK
jgi:phosphoglycolate phosphatase-like HAD superfamily hydrolase/ADP-ribose pyrophosphatase YjhB (NUDIX family)